MKCPLHLFLCTHRINTFNLAFRLEHCDIATTGIYDISWDWGFFNIASFHCLLVSASHIFKNFPMQSLKLGPLSFYSFLLFSFFFSFVEGRAFLREAKISTYFCTSTSRSGIFYTIKRLMIRSQELETVKVHSFCIRKLNLILRNSHSFFQMRQKWSHICQKLSSLVIVQQDYMHISSDKKEFHPDWLVSILPFYTYQRARDWQPKKYTFKFTHLLSMYIPFLILDLRRLI